MTRQQFEAKGAWRTPNLAGEKLLPWKETACFIDSRFPPVFARAAGKPGDMIHTADNNADVPAFRSQTHALGDAGPVSHCLWETPDLPDMLNRWFRVACKPAGCFATRLEYAGRLSHEATSHGLQQPREHLLIVMLNARTKTDSSSLIRLSRERLHVNRRQLATSSDVLTKL